MAQGDKNAEGNLLWGRDESPLPVSRLASASWQLLPFSDSRLFLAASIAW